MLFLQLFCESNTILKFKSLFLKIQVQSQWAEFGDDQSNLRGKTGGGPGAVIESNLQTL